MADTTQSQATPQLDPHLIAAIKQIVQNDPTTQAQAQAAAPPQGSKLLHLLMMLGQGADAFNTADFLKGKGRYETDPLMRPFAQAGNPLGMMGAYGMENRAIGALPSAGMQNNASILQILLNLAGIARTQHARKSGH